METRGNGVICLWPYGFGNVRWTVETRERVAAIRAVELELELNFASRQMTIVLRPSVVPRRFQLARPTGYGGA